MPSENNVYGAGGRRAQDSKRQRFRVFLHANLTWLLLPSSWLVCMHTALVALTLRRLHSQELLFSKHMNSASK